MRNIEQIDSGATMTQTGATISTGDVSPVGSYRMKVIVGNLDITDYVLSGQIERSISNPIGKWTLNLRPILDGKRIRRLPIGLNDFVEISIDRTNMMRKAGQPRSTEIRIAMRGFVDNEVLEEQSNSGLDGSPQRHYTLSGSDVGKLLERRQIFIPPGNNSIDITVGLQRFDTYFKASSYTVAEGGQNDVVGSTDSLNSKAFQPLQDWAGFFLDLVYKNDFEKMVNSSRSQADFKFNFLHDLPKAGTDASGNSVDKIYVMLPPLLNNTTTTSFWDLLSMFCPKPFIETFITEDNANTNFHLRWAAMRRRYSVGNTGNFEYGWPRQFVNKQKWFSEQVDTREIFSTDIIVRSLRRQELDRCTYFFTRLQQVIDTSAQTADYGPTNAPDTAIGRGSNPYYDRDGMAQFGIRSMVIDLPWWPAAVYESPREATSTDDTAGSTTPRVGGEIGTDLDNSLRDFTTWLVDTMTFTDDLYSGYITVLGNTDIQLGEELVIKDLGEVYYVESIEHTWAVHPAPYFLTRIGVTRGATPADFTSPESNYAIVGQTTSVDPNTGKQIVSYSRVTMGAVDVGQD